MATNSQGVFDLTMAMIDEVNEMGATDHSDTKEYKDRTLHIINVLQGELYIYSDTYETPNKGKRSIPVPVLNFEENIVSLDDYICRSVLPYGLAAHLLLDENPSAAGFFQQRYEELKGILARGLNLGSEEIEDVYGGFAHCEFCYW
jgi:hypothetical protein